MRTRDYCFSKVPDFQSRLLYAQLTSSYDYDAESAFGYRDAARECLETYKPIEELEEYIEKYSKDNGPLDSYDKAYIQAYRDFIKQEQLKKESATNE